VAIVTAFASGIAIGLWPAGAVHTASPRFLLGIFVVAILLIASALFFLALHHLRLAAALCLTAWLVLGACGAAIANQPRPRNYILNLIEAGEIDLHTPLRWHGVLRDEPTALPWGVAFDVELSSVDYQEHSIPIQGGLRATYAPHSSEILVQEVHAGDEVAIVAQARLPQLFRDERAFDRRAYLRTQGVDLTASLRNPRPLEKTVAAKSSSRTVLARLRRHLRESLAGLLPDTPHEAAVLRAMLLGDRSFL
jgi:Domain of unknown function (DUF4131)